MSALAPIQDIIADIKAGRMVILVDEEDRENEGDIVIAAEGAMWEGGSIQEVGEPDAVILRVAEQLRCDLIVIGTHGRKGFERLMIGSVAERVVRQSSCPVLTVQVSNQEKKADSANTGGT